MGRSPDQLHGVGRGILNKNLERLRRDGTPGKVLNGRFRIRDDNCGGWPLR